MSYGYNHHEHTVTTRVRNMQHAHHELVIITESHPLRSAR
ncbi:hypothetical protein [Variovorax atrisoli]|nr:hypothetical protein [Variovorax paradoxus]